MFAGTLVHLHCETLGNNECAVHLFVVHVCEALGSVIFSPVPLCVPFHQLFTSKLVFGSQSERAEILILILDIYNMKTCDTPCAHTWQ